MVIGIATKSELIFEHVGLQPFALEVGKLQVPRQQSYVGFR